MMRFPKKGSFLRAKILTTLCAVFLLLSVRVNASPLLETAPKNLLWQGIGNILQTVQKSAKSGSEWGLATLIKSSGQLLQQPPQPSSSFWQHIPDLFGGAAEEIVYLLNDAV